MYFKEKNLINKKQRKNKKKKNFCGFLKNLTKILQVSENLI